MQSDGGRSVNTGDIKAIRGEGMPMRKNPQQRGNLYIEFQVVFPPPEQLTPNIRKVCTPPPSPRSSLRLTARAYVRAQLLRKVLPPPALDPAIHRENEDLLPVGLVDVEAPPERGGNPHEVKENEF